MWRRGVALVVFLLAAVVFTPSVFAADFDYAISSTYTVNESGSVQVRTIVDVTNNVSTPTPTSLVLPVAGSVSDASAAYQDGGAITVNYAPENQTLRLETNADVSGQGRQWSIVINYTADLLNNFGDTQIVSIPPLDYGGLNITSEKTTISADLRLGVAVARGPQPDTSRIVAGRQVLTWVNGSGPIKDAVGVLFGEQAVAEARYQHTLKNNSWWWQDVTLTLPADTNQQRVFIKDITPQPSNVRLDIDGNILASWRLRPQASVSVEANVTIVVNNYSYNFDGAGDDQTVPPQIAERYTANFGEWQDSEIKAEGDSLLQRVESIYMSVAGMDFEGEDRYQRSLASSNQLVGELRANQVPARLVLGYVFGDGGQVFDEPQQQAWVEAYIAGVGWITLDPLFEKRGDYFGTTDVQHVALLLRGINPEIPPAFLDAASVTYTENDVPEVPPMVPELRATSHMILPGLAIRSLNVEMPVGVIVDGNGVQVGDGAVRSLGSLAPLQRVTLRSVRLGPQAFQSAQVQYGPLSADGIDEVISEADLKVNYLPMIIILIAALLAFIGRWIWRRRGPAAEKPKRSKDAVVFASEEGGDSIEHANLLPRPEQPPLPPADEQTPPPSGDTMSQTPPPATQRRTRIQ